MNLKKMKIGQSLKIVALSDEEKIKNNVDLYLISAKEAAASLKQAAKILDAGDLNFEVADEKYKKRMEAADALIKREYDKIKIAMKVLFRV